MFVILLLLSLFHVNFCCKNEVTIGPSFSIDHKNDQFLLDGKPFRYVSGSFHYFRTPRQYWRDRFRKMRLAGLNAVSTYVEWSLHQPEYDKWVWDGDADLVEFIKQAQEEDLFVLLRPGPYICAEREFGGFPYWLLTREPDIKLRTSDPKYMKYVEVFLNETLKRVKPYLRGNGGPIIMVQVENEYGSFYACDKEYRVQLRDLMKKHVEDKAVLYTTDGSWKEAINCGQIEGVYATIDFGTSGNVTRNFDLMRSANRKGGPLVNSEFYPGWLCHWEEPFQRVDTNNVTRVLNEMLKRNASVNIYMFYGGTNFAFSSGANIFGNYTPDLTSYDYDAPLSEAGDPTPKYFAIREVVRKYLPIPKEDPPTVSKKGNYGSVTMRPVVRLLDSNGRKLYGTKKIEGTEPYTFEALKVSNWLVLYEFNVPESERNEETLVFKAAPKDRVLIYTDGRFSGVLSRAHNVTKTILAPSSKRIKLLVENQGRVNFGNIDIADFKGIFNVTLNERKITSWNMTGFRFDNILESSLESIIESTKKLEAETLMEGPQILIGHFYINEEENLLDTYLNTANWGKGVAFVNGHNLGRYWPLIGPQLTLYVPATYLNRGKNVLVLVELEYVPKNYTINFQTTPILDYPT